MRLQAMSDARRPRLQRPCPTPGVLDSEGHARCPEKSRRDCDASAQDRISRLVRTLQDRPIRDFSRTATHHRGLGVEDAVAEERDLGEDKPQDLVDEVQALREPRPRARLAVLPRGADLHQANKRLRLPARLLIIRSQRFMECHLPGALRRERVMSLEGGPEEADVGEGVVDALAEVGGVGVERVADQHHARLAFRKEEGGSALGGLRIREPSGRRLSKPLDLFGLHGLVPVHLGVRLTKEGAHALLGRQLRVREERVVGPRDDVSRPPVLALAREDSEARLLAHILASIGGDHDVRHLSFGRAPPPDDRLCGQRKVPSQREHLVLEPRRRRLDRKHVKALFQLCPAPILLGPLDEARPHL
mmetsp:Transcript_55167/g.131359  ORF Transcript_55167/g.131359 Transcript_55167/m.131359 type:complete len:361 (+) Transcript_55167:23-1105(+)